ncbi:hypothetical protein BLSTO_02871 [Blastocystis sp. subtype 1]
MQRSPVDDIIDKIVAELLKLNQVDYVSQSTFNSMSEIVKTYIRDIGRRACEEANLTMKPTVNLQHIILAINSKQSLSDLAVYVKQKDLPSVFGYTIPNSSYKNVTTLPHTNLYALYNAFSVREGEVPTFLPDLPLPHSCMASEVMAVAREKDESLNRKRLLEERRCVKKSICAISDTNTVLWETQELQERKRQRTEVMMPLRINA